MLPVVNEARARRVSVSELILGVKCGGSDGFSGLSANPALGHAADLLVRAGRHRRHHRGAGVLRRRAHPRAPREGSRDRRSRVRDGGLVQGVRVEVRHGARREPEPRQRRRRPAEHHDQVARRHRQGRHHARRRGLRVRRGAVGQGAVADAGARLRPGVDAGTRRGRRAGRGLHHRPRHDDRQRDRAGREARVEHRRASAHVARSGSLGRRHHRRHRNHRAGRRARVRARHPRRLRRGARKGRGDQAPRVQIWAEQSVSL